MRRLLRWLRVRGWRHENRVTVGVRAWARTTSADRAAEWDTSLGACWVEIDGKRVPGQVVSVRLEELRSDEFSEVVVRLICGKFETVPA